MLNQKLNLAIALCLWALAAVPNEVQAQCASNEIEVEVILVTDNFGYETSWSIVNDNGTALQQSAPNLSSATTYNHSYCLPDNGCYHFLIEDSYGDGICCTYGIGYYLVIVDGDTVANGGNFTNSETTYFNCPTGSFCNDTDTVGIGTYATTLGDHWYTFIPDTTGMFQITTCGTNTCNTKIWVYDRCNGLTWDESNIGTVFYDDNSCGGLQAVVNAALAAGDTYFIRIGDSNDDCVGTAVNWAINYNGPIVGCTDPAACNYNPLATVTDTCYYPGTPNCPDGPDLILRQDVFESSMYLTTYTNNSNCLVQEQCVTGLGLRDFIRFTTHIENNGTQDYYIGNPTTQPGQFNNTNCHGHWHYEGYAEYLLFDQNGAPLPIGYKNGFCVLDLVCDNGGSAQYGCGNMGISAGCGDIYDASLDCQWIDVTNVPDGDYTFVARVNWDYSPDALGRMELDYANNWAQVCITLDRSSGSLQMTKNPNCPTYTDCAGQPFGSAVPDCNGICNGSAVAGDLNADLNADLSDVQDYLDAALAGNTTATNCNDLFDDDAINIADAASLLHCLQDPAFCDFPEGFVNIFDTVGLRIINADFTNKFIDIAMRNPSAKVMGYQFTMSGIVVDTVVSLVAPADYPEVPVASAANSMVLAMSMQDSTVERSNTPQNLCRVYFSSTTDTEICIDSIYAVVNELYQTTTTRIEGSCVQVPVVSVNAIPNTDLQVKVAPNPFNRFTRFSFYNPNQLSHRLEIVDAMGRLVRLYDNINGEEFLLHKEELVSGVYHFRLSNNEKVASGKLVIE